MGQPSDTQILKVSCRSRPKRLAYLVDPQSVTPEHFDELFACSMDHWGGRLHAVIPVVDGNVSQAWWKPLELLDPDLIVTFCDLGASLLERIERQILPLSILGLKAEDRNRWVHPYVPAYQLDLVGITSIPQQIWLKRGPLQDPVFVRFKRRSPVSSDHRVVLRNFGVVSDDVQTQAAFRDLPVEDIDDATIGLAATFDRLAELGSRCVLPADLSAYDAAFPAQLLADPATQGFHLVVGDGPYEAAYHWNRSLCAQSWYGRTTLWVPSSIGTDAALVEAIFRWIQRCYWEQGWARTGQIVSFSLDEGRLREIANALSHGGRLRLSVSRLSPDQFPFPDGHAAPSPDWAPSFVPLGRGNLNAHVLTQRATFSQGSALIDPPRPPAASENDGNAGWMVDLQIQFHPDRYAYTNVRPDWTLPKRDGLSQLFVQGQHSRIVAGGLPSVENRPDIQSLTITIPHDRDVFGVLLLGNPYGARQEGIPTQRTRFREMWTSDEGAALRGMLRLFGGLWHCGRFFADPFWRGILLEMAKGESGRKRWRTLSRLQQRFSNLRQEALLQDVDRNFWNQQRSFDEPIRGDFDSLVEAGVFKQGTEIRCPNCGSHCWYAVEDLRQSLACIGCGDVLSLPTETPWSYRLNELVSNALRSRGTLAVIQALYLLDRESRGMFLGHPSQNLSEEPDAKPVTDLDIVALVGGLFVIGEAKSVASGFNEEVTNKLADLAADIRPDRLVFAAPEDQWPQDVVQRITSVREKLAPFGVEVRELRMKWI